MKAKLTDEDRATAQFLINLSQRFMGIKPTITMRDIKAYGYVGLDEGHSVQQYAWLAREAPGTMGRCLLDMGPRNRWGQAGALLIESSAGYSNQKAHYLTQSGIELLHEIAALRQTGEMK